MLDVILVVDDPVQWHRENLRVNSSHYSLLGRLELLHRGLFFNTHVPGERLTKYGVLSTSDFLVDLETWSSLYVAGRLHKPVEFLKTDSHFDKALATNLESAVAASLVLLPSRFDELSLFMTIASLSYDGDVRFAIGGENPRKVQNIVESRLARFRSYYKSTLQSYCDDGTLSFDGEFVRRKDATRNIPVKQRPLKEALRAIVRRSSLVQTVKGICTAGPYKSFLYAKAKRQKALDKS